MQQSFHQANSRGHADLGWLNSSHTISFCHYNPAGKGFGIHQNHSKDTIRLALSGVLESKDCMYPLSVLQKGEVEVMSTFSGIQRFENNHIKTDTTEFLQQWNKLDEVKFKPSYDQQTFPLKVDNQFREIIGRQGHNNKLWIHLHARSSDLSKQMDLRFVI